MEESLANLKSTIEGGRAVRETVYMPKGYPLRSSIRHWPGKIDLTEVVYPSYLKKKKNYISGQWKQAQASVLGEGSVLRTAAKYLSYLKHQGFNQKLWDTQRNIKVWPKHRKWKSVNKNWFQMDLGVGFSTHTQISKVMCKYVCAMLCLVNSVVSNVLWSHRL